MAVGQEFKVRIFIDTCTIQHTAYADEVIKNYLRAAGIMPLFGTGQRITHEECSALVEFSKMVDLEIKPEVISQEYRGWLKKKYTSALKDLTK